MCENAWRWVHRVTRPVDSKGPQREESATFMGRIVGLLVLGLALAMVGFGSSALFWLGIVGLVMFVATGFVGAINATVHPVEQQVGDGLMSSHPARVRLGRPRPMRVRGPVTRRPGVGGLGGKHRRSSHR
jgi:hypothetical protein